MKKILLFLLICNSSIIFAQEKNETSKIQIVEASCGQCQFGMKEKGCDLAVRIEGKSYFVKGTSIDSYGDAHAKDGFCTCIRKAEVVEEIKDNIFIATYFKLMPIQQSKS